jgi:hypothetical protein
MKAVPDPLKDVVAGMAALLNEQVPDGNPDTFIQQLRSRVHHPEGQKHVITANRYLNLGKPSYFKIKLLALQETPPVSCEDKQTDRRTRPTHLPIGMEGPIGP